MSKSADKEEAVACGVRGKCRVLTLFRVFGDDAAKTTTTYQVHQHLSLRHFDKIIAVGDSNITIKRGLHSRLGWSLVRVRLVVLCPVALFVCNICTGASTCDGICRRRDVDYCGTCLAANVTLVRSLMATSNGVLHPRSESGIIYYWRS